jgi:hypothetical protein
LTDEAGTDSCSFERIVVEPILPGVAGPEVYLGGTAGALAAADAAAPALGELLDELHAENSMSAAAPNARPLSARLGRGVDASIDLLLCSADVLVSGQQKPTQPNGLSRQHGSDVNTVLNML